MGFLGKWSARGARVLVLGAAVSCFLWHKDADAVLYALGQQSHPEVRFVTFIEYVPVFYAPHHDEFALPARYPVNEAPRARFAEKAASAKFSVGSDIASRLASFQASKIKFRVFGTDHTASEDRWSDVIGRRLAGVPHGQIKPDDLPKSEIVDLGIYDANIGPNLFLTQFTSDRYRFVRRASGLAGSNCGPCSEEDSKKQAGNLKISRAELPSGSPFHFLRCFGHAPLLAQIGLFGGLGIVANALIISGIGGCLGLISMNRQWGAVCVLAGVMLCISFYALNEAQYGPMKSDKCQNQASSNLSV